MSAQRSSLHCPLRCIAFGDFLRCRRAIAAVVLGLYRSAHVPNVRGPRRLCALPAPPVLTVQPVRRALRSRPNASPARPPASNTPVPSPLATVFSSANPQVPARASTTPLTPTNPRRPHATVLAPRTRSEMHLQPHSAPRRPFSPPTQHNSARRSPAPVPPPLCPSQPPTPPPIVGPSHHF